MKAWQSLTVGAIRFPNAFDFEIDRAQNNWDNRRVGPGCCIVTQCACGAPSVGRTQRNSGQILRQCI